MKLEEAIEILKVELRSKVPGFTNDYWDALKLGIEALKYYQQERERRGATKTMWLSGETEE